MSWGGTICFVMGVPVVFPRPLTILQEIDAKGRYRFRTYFYETSGILATRLFNMEEWFTVQQRIQGLDSAGKDRIALAIRWYGLGLGEKDSTLQFLAYWIALEALGDELNRRFHKAGEKAPCLTCRNQAGKGRSGSKAGMTHMLALVAGDAGLFDTLQDTRNKMFHGLKDIHAIASSITAHLGELQTAVIQATLTVLTPPGSVDRSTAFKPERSVTHQPQIIVEGTILDATPEERTEILYRAGFVAERVHQKWTNTPDGDIEVTGDFRLGGVIPRHRLADLRITHVPPAGVEVRLPRKNETTASPPQTPGA
jgi:hypothetical protein